MAQESATLRGVFEELQETRGFSWLPADNFPVSQPQ
jgi:hypothetical protein